MQEEWYQLWANIPIIGRQWAGWIRTNQLSAQGLALSLQGCPGVNYTLLTQGGQEVTPQVVLPTIPGAQFPF